VARVNKQDLADLPARWTDRQRGRYLRRLLRQQGINPDRLFQVAYYPHWRCWLLTQEESLSGPAARPMAVEGDEAFYMTTTAELRRTALLAVRAQAAQPTHSASFGVRFPLPPPPQPLTPAELASLLGGPGDSPATVRFDSEGGWQPVKRRKS